MQTSGEQLLLQGQQLREAGKTLEAIDYLNKAMQTFVIEHNYARFAHALLDRGICWQHLYQLNENNIAFAILYKKDAEAMLDLLTIKNIDEELDGAYFMNAKAAMVFGEYQMAVEFFNKAIEKLSPKKNAQRGDWQTNLGNALYFSGQKEQGLQTMLNGIEQIKKYANEVDEYTLKIWLSGAYLRLAEVSQQYNPDQSKNYLEMAQNLIGNDPKFVVRKKQIDNFMKTKTSGI